jgi:PhzF family phenazine biosynthesis protein
LAKPGGRFQKFKMILSSLIDYAMIDLDLGHPVWVSYKTKVQGAIVFSPEACAIFVKESRFEKPTGLKSSRYGYSCGGTTMKIPIYQIDAFTGSVFCGNPAAVCPLEKWLDESVMQAIAQENNLSETAFFVKEKEDYRIRWFTPVAEVDLCGHATLASAFVVFNYLDMMRDQVVFKSRSGPLRVLRDEEMISMDFPSQPPRSCSLSREILDGLGKEPLETLCSADYFMVFERERDVRELIPDMGTLKKLDLRGVIVSAPGDEADFVSRFFAPALGIDEDPVTGSAHCALIPYWSRKLGKIGLHAYQVSRRGGELFCADRGDRVIISGRAVRYMEGRITIGHGS